MGKLVGIILGAIFCAVILIVGAAYLTYANQGARFEARIDAQRLQNENLLAQHEQKVLEAAQVPAMQTEDLKSMYRDVMQGRYGAEGSKALFQMLREDNPKLDQTTYIKLQQIIEAGRNDFANGQKNLLDVCRAYKTNLKAPWSGFWLGVAGYPQIDLDKQCAIVSTNRAGAAFETGKETAPLKLR